MPKMPFDSKYSSARVQLKSGASKRVLALAIAPIVLGSALDARAGTVSGRVTDATTGSSLNGALISVVGTDQTTSSARDGSYSLANIPGGSHEIAVSYLGYQAVKHVVSVPAEGAVSADFAVPQSVAGDRDELVVIGNRLSQDRALNEQRTSAGVSNVITADDIGKFPDNNVADAISRLPGLSVFHNRETGEGEYVTIRGLDSTFNAYSVNGVRTATTNQGDRAVSLTVLPPFGLQSIKVSKTVTPDMDGDAIGGTVDFRTPNAFDFNKPVARVFYQFGLHERALSQGEPAMAHTGQVDLGNVFGDNKQFGIYASAYYLTKDSISEESENQGEWEPYQYRANSTENINEKTLNLPGIDLDYYKLKQERYGANTSLDYHGDNQTLYVRAQYAHFIKTDDHSEFFIQAKGTPRLQQVNPNDTSLAQPGNSIKSVLPDGTRVYNYTPQQIVDQNHDGIITDADLTGNSYWSLLGKSGVYAPQNYIVDRNYETKDEVQQLGTSEIGGTSTLGSLKLDYQGFYSWGEKSTPNYYSVEYTADQNAYPFNSTGVTFSSPDPRFPIWQLPAYAQSSTNDNSLLLPNGATHYQQHSFDKRLGATLNGHYDVGEYLINYVQAGVKVQQSIRNAYQTYLFQDQLPYANLAASPLIDRDLGPILDHEYEHFGALFNRSAVEAAIRAQGVGTFSADTQNGNTTSGTEGILAGYAMADLKYDDLEAIIGVRVERTDVHNTFWAFDTVSHWASSNSSYTILLPSIHINYRPDPYTVYRAAAWTSFARPEYQYVTGGQSITRNAAGEITAISQGNPNLGPTKTNNYDAGVEYYTGNAGLASFDVYYKGIRNFIFTNGNSVSATTTSGFIDVTQPQNGKAAQLFGFEVNLQQQLDGLPSPFDGFGFGGNFTFQQSSADTGLPYRADRHIALINAPDMLYNIALFYQKHGVEADIAYNWQDKFIEDLRDNAVDKWNQPYERLDFHSRYTFDNGLVLGFEVQNLLDTYGYYTSKGPSPAYQKDYIEPGRSYLFNVSYSY